MKALVAAFTVSLSLAFGISEAQPLPTGEPEAKKSKPAKPKQKGSASAGRSAPPGPLLPEPPNPERDAAFRVADMDGDGLVSKAEAAGNETLVVGFFRADRNRDGKLTRDEYETIFRPKVARKGKPAVTASAGKSSGTASTGKSGETVPTGQPGGPTSAGPGGTASAGR